MAGVGSSRRRLRCDHLVGTVSVVFTELGCHAWYPRCSAVGPERPSSSGAREALLASGARLVNEDNSQYRQGGRVRRSYT